jgi:hypothetical protein
MALPDIDPKAPPSGAGCVECEQTHGWWLHLRRRATCGHIGCCDHSPSAHAVNHVSATGHPVITTFETDENWFFDYRAARLIIPRRQLAPPRHHPIGQAVPGPQGRVPPDWMSRLNL